MKRVFVLAAVSIVLLGNAASGARQTAKPVLLHTVKQLPVAPDPDFEFRKTKLFLISQEDPQSRRTAKGKGKNRSADFTSSKVASAAQAAPITFERKYYLFGAVTALDQRQRYGNYFDFFWRVKRPADVTVRLEYRQEKFHAHVQAQEISYQDVRGSQKTAFKVVGDDYFDGGRVIAWRCLLISDGKIVAENRSFLWK